jgi:hypothetical protein
VEFLSLVVFLVCAFGPLTKIGPILGERNCLPTKVEEQSIMKPRRL